MRKIFLQKIMLCVGIAALVSSACMRLPTKSDATPAPNQVETTPVPATESSIVNAPEVGQTAYAPPFATYKDIAIRLPVKYANDYSLPLDLNQVDGISNITLSDNQRQKLSQNGFVVLPPQPGEYREFYQAYEIGRYDNVSLFITSDSVLHVYHLIFDKMLRDLENTKFIPGLESLTRTMIQASEKQFEDLKGTALEEPARRNLAFFVVAARLLELSDPVPASVEALVQAEMGNIEAHSGPVASPIWEREDQAPDKVLIEDYSQYIPRGHYTRSDALKRYFKTMMWYGRLTFRLRDDFETQRALLVTQALRNATSAEGTSAVELWQNIFEPTVFLVGKADDLSYTEYGAISDAVYGANPDIKSFGDATLLTQFKEAAKKLPPPQVNSMWVWIWEDRDDATQGFRFMGQRFTLDAYVFGQLIYRKVGTDTDPRDLPKGLDFFAAQGSEEALKILTEMNETHYANYNEQMTKVTQEIATLEQDSWTQNVYWNWLYTLRPLISEKDERYPAFMRTQAWVRKDLSTALSSWTELKHDTILYAKQVMAEMGGGGPEEPPHGYVEPNPEVFARLRALSQMTLDGLNTRGLAEPPTTDNLDNMIDLLTFLQSCAEKELAAEPLSTDDYWRIKYFGGELEAITLAAADSEDEMGRDLSDQKAALIADVATGFDRVLEEAIGQPTLMYVIAPDQPWRVTIGVVFTYYEFPLPSAERMTDETWQAQVESSNPPAQPDWTTLFSTP